MATKCQRLKPKQSIVRLAISRFVSEIHRIIMSHFFMKILSVFRVHFLHTFSGFVNYKIATKLIPFSEQRTVCTRFAASLVLKYKIKLVAKQHIEIRKWNSGFSTCFV